MSQEFPNPEENLHSEEQFLGNLNEEQKRKLREELDGFKERHDIT